MKKSLEEWKEEIDAGIARGKADFKAGHFYESNDDFFESIKKEAISEKNSNFKINFLKEGVLI